jgi:hypothetical protein
MSSRRLLGTLLALCLAGCATADLLAGQPVPDGRAAWPPCRSRPDGRADDPAPAFANGPRSRCCTTPGSGRPARLRHRASRRAVCHPAQIEAEARVTWVTVGTPQPQAEVDWQRGRPGGAHRHLSSENARPSSCSRDSVLGGIDGTKEFAYRNTADIATPISGVAALRSRPGRWSIVRRSMARWCSPSRPPLARPARRGSA